MKILNVGYNQKPFSTQKTNNTKQNPAFGDSAKIVEDGGQKMVELIGDKVPEDFIRTLADEGLRRIFKNTSWDKPLRKVQPELKVN